jgi:protein involved in polysaccharide export with SLBB domain
VRIFARAAFVDPHFVRISGLVHKPGVYPMTDGMRVRDLVLRADNVHKLAYLENAELTRHTFSAGGDLTLRVDINLGKVLAGDPAHNLELQDFDHLLVRQIPGVEIQGTIEQVGATPVTEIFPIAGSDEAAVAALRRAGIVQDLSVVLSGEVRFPGVYPIQKGEHLSSVLRRAGGFTDKAYLHGAVFTRQSAREAQEKRLQQLIREEEEALLTEGAAEAEAALTEEEVQARRQALEVRRALLTRLRTVQLEGRVVVRLQALEAFAGSEQDIELESGDRLVIPQTPKYVNVIGEVYNRVSLIYEPGKELAYYLEKVGGIKPNANEKEISLVQVDGTVFSNTQDRFLVLRTDGSSTYLGDFYTLQPRPGDTIVVPRRVETPATLRNIRDIVQIIFQSISAVGIVVALIL